MARHHNTREYGRSGERKAGEKASRRSAAQQRDRFHETNHHRQSGPMKDRRRELTEAELIEEELDAETEELGYQAVDQWTVHEDGTMKLTVREARFDTREVW